MVSIPFLVLRIAAISAKSVAKATIAKTVPITDAKQKNALPAKETLQMMKRDVKILRYGPNQTVVVESADVNSMGSSVFEHISLKR